MFDVDLDSRISHNKKLIFNILEQNKVKSITVSFDGGGDSGQVDNITIKPSSKKTLLIEPVVGFKCLRHVEYKNGERTPVYHDDNDPEMNIEFVLNAICYDLLERSHSGWEINDGSFGDFIFDVKTKSIKLMHNERYTDVRYTESKF